jgi:hypothetical protein
MLKTVGWTALIVTNPDPEPSLWQAHELETPLNPLGILVGFAAVQRLNEGYIVAIRRAIDRQPNLLSEVRPTNKMSVDLSDVAVHEHVT